MREHHLSLDERNSNIPSQEDEKFIVYQGPSMNPTLQDMDVLYYVPDKRIRSGDVIVFNVPGVKYKIIHRVIYVGKKGIRTMGDGNPRPDNWLLNTDLVLGSVTYGYRGRRRFCVSGGLAGLIQIFQVRLKYSLLKTAYPVLNILYHKLHISNLVIFLIQPRSVAFKRPNGTEMHLISRGMVIGRRMPGQKWQIKSPFKFFLDESILPD